MAILGFIITDIVDAISLFLQRSAKKSQLINSKQDFGLSRKFLRQSVHPGEVTVDSPDPSPPASATASA